MPSAAEGLGVIKVVVLLADYESPFDVDLSRTFVIHRRNALVTSC